MEVAFLAPDGLRLSTQAPLSQLISLDLVRDFAAGLLSAGLSYTNFSGTLAEALYRPGPAVDPLLTVLLVLDAEVEAEVGGKRRVLPLSSFWAYGDRLASDKVSLTTLRLPPLNPDGHYSLRTMGDGSFLAVRLDLHPTLGVMGHVRLAVSGAHQFPVRLLAAEHRLERQVLNKRIIQAALVAEIAASAPPLSPAEQTTFTETLVSLMHH